MAPRDSFASISQMSVLCFCYNQDFLFFKKKIVLNSNCFSLSLLFFSVSIVLVWFMIEKVHRGVTTYTQQLSKKNLAAITYNVMVP